MFCFYLPSGGGLTGWIINFSMQRYKKNLVVSFFFCNFAIPFAKVAQLVEHDLAKVGVVGSSPIFRSILPPFRGFFISQISNVLYQKLLNNHKFTKLSDCKVMEKDGKPRQRKLLISTNKCNFK